VDLSVAQISKFLQSFAIGKEGKTFILERNGNLVSTNSTQMPFTLAGVQLKRIPALDFEDSLIQASVRYLKEQFDGDLSQIDDTQELKFKIHGQEQLLQVVPLRGIDWLIVVVVLLPRSRFLKSVQVNFTPSP